MTHDAAREKACNGDGNAHYDDSPTVFHLLSRGLNDAGIKFLLVAGAVEYPSIKLALR